MDDALLRRLITELLLKTESARQLPFGIVGRERAKLRTDSADYLLEHPGASTASNRQWADNEAAGRIAWHMAYEDARSAHWALDHGKPEEALGWLTMAMWWYADALEKRVQPTHLKAFGHPSKRRGRRRTV
jgi:hypothetical protein